MKNRPAGETTPKDANSQVNRSELEPAATPQTLGRNADGHLRRITRVLWVAIAILALFLAVRLWVLTPYKIPTASMEPTLRGDHPTEEIDGDTVLVLKSAYLFSDPRRWDLVAFEAVEDKDKQTAPPASVVKRVVGLPGEEVEIRDGDLYINGERMTPPGAIAKCRYTNRGAYGYDPVRLGPDEYFVLGDNSYLSLDSRHWGPLPRSHIFGKIIVILHPWNRAGWLSTEDSPCP